MSSKIYLLILLILQLNCFSMGVKQEVELYVPLKNALEKLNLNKNLTIEENLEKHLQDQILTIFFTISDADFIKNLVGHQVGKLISAAYSIEKINEALFHYATKSEITLGTLTTNVKVQFLLYSGADINAQNSSGYTVINIATQNGNLNLVKFLLEKGACVSNDLETAKI